MANKLALETRVQILNLLVESNSMRSVKLAKPNDRVSPAHLSRLD